MLPRRLLSLVRPRPLWSRALVHGSAAALPDAHDAALPHAPPLIAPRFDTHHVHTTLTAANALTAPQGDAVVAALTDVNRQVDHWVTLSIASAEERVKLASRVEVGESLHAFALGFQHDLATLRDELKKLETDDYKKLEEELDELEQRHHRQLQDLFAEMKMLEERRNSTRQHLNEQIDTKLERMENKMIRWSLGFGGTVALLGLGVTRLILSM